MPHVVLDKKIDLKKFLQSFEEIFLNEQIMIKISNIFIDKAERTALLPTTVIESQNQHFLIEINAKDNKTTIRLFPGTDPQKTDGVKISLGLVASTLTKIFSDAKVTKTNIEEFIPVQK